MEYLPIENESVLDSVRQRLGGVEFYGDSFDGDILSAINSAFSTLHQLGIDGKDKKPIRIVTTDQKWDDIFDVQRYGWIKDYIYLKVKLIFDPPSNSSVLNSMQSQLDELTWRIEVERDYEINEDV